MDLSEILQLEKNVENTMMGVLSAACENVYHSRQVDINATPRISFKAVIGPEFQNQKLIISQDPGWIYSSYAGVIKSTVSTNRTTEQKSDAHNETLGVARLRHHQFYVNQWQEAQSAVDPATLPLLIFDIRPAENEDDEEDTDDIDNTTLTHTILFSINPAALPTNL